MRFAHSNLAAYDVIKGAVVRGERVARTLPRAHSKLADQLRRALQGAFLQFVEGVARDGDDRRSRLRTARAEAGEAAAALDLIAAVGLVRTESIPETIAMLERFCAMTTGLGKLNLDAPATASAPAHSPTPSPAPAAGPSPAPCADPDLALPLSEQVSKCSS